MNHLSSPHVGPLFRSFRMSMVLAAIAVIGMTQQAHVAEGATPQPTGNACERSEMVGVFTGEFVNGVPVYRFPAVVVAGPRSAAPASSAERVARPRTMKAPAKGAA